MAEPEEQLLQSCTNCATLIDISGEEPFTQIHCPVCGTALRARTQVRNFTLQEVLGSGGMGAVYKALDLNLNRLVALKVVRKEFSSDPEYLAKFDREAQITASVTHPHVVKVFSFGQDHGLYYIAMELVDKGSLDDLMNLQGRVAEAQVLQVGIQIAQGLQAAHNRGLIHRDVKPGNILFADAHTSKIVDFGLALLTEHEAESRGEVWGTPYYVAPEKLNHEPEDFRSDIYSLGGTLFHAVAGRPPFEAETASLVALKHIKSQAVSIQAFAPDVSSAAAYVINRMLHKDPDQRYQSYDELIEHLQYARAQLTESGEGPRQKTRVVMETREQRNAMAWVTLGLLGILIAAGVLLFVFRDRVFKKEETAEVQAQRELQGITGKYAAARKQLAAGDAEGAYQAFSTLLQGTTVPVSQPLKSWIKYHQGLSAVVADHPAEGRAVFKEIKDSGPYSTDPEEKRLADVFVTIGTKMADEKVIPGTVARTFSTRNSEAAALLAFAMKDWQMGKFDDAGPILKAFVAGNPEPAFQWIAEYKPLAQHYLADYEAYKGAAAKVQQATSPDKAAEAMQAIQQVRNSAQTKGRILDKLKELEAALKKKISAADEAEQQRLVQQEADRQTLAAAEIQFSKLCADYRFAEARTFLAGVKITDEEVLKKKSVVLKKAEWLAKFKTVLIGDISRAGYPNPVKRKAGGQVEGGVAVAVEKQVQIRTPYGFIPVNWADIAPATVLQMASYFSNLTGSPDPDRVWLSGVFACAVGMEREGHTLVVQASKSKAEYRNELDLFFDSADAK